MKTIHRDLNGILSRRRFLAASGTFCVAGALQRRAWAVGPGPVTFGFSTYGLKSLSTEEAIREIAGIGYDSVEISALAGWDADPAALTPDRRAAIRRQLQDSGLKLTALMDNLPLPDDSARHEAALGRLKAAAQLSHDLSPNQPPLIETVLGGGPDLDKAKPIFLRRLVDWIKIADAQDVVIAIKPHRDNAINRPEQAVELFRELGEPKRLRLVYDYSHFAFRDMPMDETIRTALPFTCYVALKDVAIEAGKAVFKLPGETGQIDYTAMIRQFAAAGYVGDFNCEVSAQISVKPGYNGVDAAKRCYAAVAPAFVASGVKRQRAR